MTSVLHSAPAAPMLTSFTIQATLSPLTDQRAGKYPLGPAPPISRQSPGKPGAVHLIGERLTELQRPLPHRLVADDDAARGQHLLDHTQAEWEAEIKPNRVADDLGRKPVAGVAGGSKHCHPVRLRDLARNGKPPT